MRTVRLFLVVLLAFGITTAAENPALKPLEFLMGDWVGEGTGQPGEGSGGFSLKFELQGKILVRRNHADYLATKERPASSHEDLMVIYPEADTLRADYFDNEGHVIHYQVTPTTNEPGVQFVSQSSIIGPAYRLTYTKSGASQVKIKFEVAPPGLRSKFATYIDATATRK